MSRRTLGRTTCMTCMDLFCLFPFVKIQDINCSSKIFFPSLGGSRWVLGIHGGSLGPKPLRDKCYWISLSCLPNSGDSSRPSVTEDPPGWLRPAGMMIRWGVGWAEDMDGKCLCVASCLGSHPGPSRKNQWRRRMFSGNYSVCTSSVSPIHLHQLLLSSCSVI